MQKEAKKAASEKCLMVKRGVKQFLMDFAVDLDGLTYCRLFLLVTNIML